MRRFPLAHLVCCLGVMTPGLVHAQTTSVAPASPASTAAHVTSSDAQAPADEAASQPAPATEPPQEEPRSLFEPSPRQFLLGGRFTHVDGDPARFQRYQDLRDGLLFTDARYAKDTPDGASLFRLAADNVGFRDQHYVADYERAGRFSLSGSWQGIPQFYSVDTQTPYTTRASPLLLDDGTQRAIQNGQATLSAWVPLATPFDLTERRDIGKINFLATPSPHLDVKAAFTSTHHVGELPWGASFGFSNDVEVPLPYDSRTNDLTLGTEWTNGKTMIRAAYDGSWFSNPDNPLVWDSPLRADDSTSAPGRGSMSLWPSNSAQTVSVAGFSKFAHRTQVTGSLSFGFWNNQEPLQPFTINSALPVIPLPRATSDAAAHGLSTNVNFVSRPAADWRLTARVRHNDYNNDTPPTSIPQYVSYDASVNTSTTGGPLLYAHRSSTFDANATWTGLHPLALTAGYKRTDNGYDYRTFTSAGENGLHLTADTTGSQWVTFRAEYELAERTGSGLDTSGLTQIGEQTGMRQFDLANRNRNKFTGQVDLTPSDAWTFSVSGGVGKDTYPDSEFGLQDSTFQTFSLGIDHQMPDGLVAGGTYNYERNAGLQHSRSAKSDPAQFNDPARNWSVDSREQVNYFSLYLTPKLRPGTELRLSYDFSYAEGNYFYTVVAGGPLPPPSQLPKVYNKLQQLHVDVRHRLSQRTALDVTYLYEPFRVYDFAFDPSVIDGIAQPSSLVLGYVYRPYTANSATISLRYVF